MTYNFGTGVLVAAGLFSVATTLSAGFAPARFAERLGLKVLNAGGVNEIRAQYAAFFLAAAAVCFAALFGAVARPTAFILLTTVFGGLIAGRIVSLALNGGVAGYPPMILALYGIDALGFALSLTAYLTGPHS